MLMLILSPLLLSSVVPTTQSWYIADYPKQATRMKKIVRDGFEVAMETLPHDPSNWREAFVKTLKQLKSYGWEIFKGKGLLTLIKPSRISRIY